MKLAIEIIEKGNPKGQAKFLEYLMKDKENSFFVNLYSLLESSFLVIYKEMNTKNDGLFNNIIAENDVENIHNMKSTITSSQTISPDNKE